MLSDSALIAEGFHEWDVESTLARMDAEVNETGGAMIWASMKGLLKLRDFYKVRVKRLSREHCKYRIKWGVPRPRHTSDDRGYDIEFDDLGYSDDEELAAAIETMLWPNVKMFDCLSDMGTNPPPISGGR